MEQRKNVNKLIAILLLGIGGTGKSTIATHLIKILKRRRKKILLIRFDELRKELTPSGEDPFSKDPRVKSLIYDKALQKFSDYLRQGYSLIIDSGLSVESIRKKLKTSIPQMKICHVYCPLVVAILRDTKRSILHKEHERGNYLHLRALFDLVNPLKKEKFPQPGITYKFEYP